MGMDHRRSIQVGSTFNIFLAHLLSDIISKKHFGGIDIQNDDRTGSRHKDNQLQMASEELWETWLSPWTGTVHGWIDTDPSELSNASRN